MIFPEIETDTGVAESFVDPLPSFPPPLDPQAKMLPSDLTAKALEHPRDRSCLSGSPETEPAASAISGDVDERSHIP